MYQKMLPTCTQIFCIHSRRPDYDAMAARAAFATDTATSSPNLPPTICTLIGMSLMSSGSSVDRQSLAIVSSKCSYKPRLTLLPIEFIAHVPRHMLVPRSPPVTRLRIQINR